LKGSVPRSLADAVVRDLVSLIPVIGDVFMLYEAAEALKEKEDAAAMAYLLGGGPGPALPFTHVVLYALKKRGLE